MDIPVTNGLKIRGTYIRHYAGERRGVILFGLEFGSDRWSSQSYCERLVAAPVAGAQLSGGDWVSSDSPRCFSAQPDERCFAGFRDPFGKIGGAANRGGVPVGREHGRYRSRRSED